MTPKHLLHCECGGDMEVNERQAGQERVCICGKTLVVPALRQIRALPPASLEATASTASSRWTFQRGMMFSLGALLLLLCLPTFAYVSWQRAQIDRSQPDLMSIEYQQDIDLLSPLDTLELWKFIAAQSLFRDNAPRHILNRQRAERLGWLMAITGVFSAGGLISVIAALRS